jgi:hypothetical protein
MRSLKLYSVFFIAIFTITIPNLGYAAAAGKGSGSDGMASTAYREIPVPAVIQADVNIRKRAINKVLGAGGFDVSNNIRLREKEKADASDKEKIEPIYKGTLSREMKDEFRYSLPTGAYVSSDKKLFYVKGQQPKFGRWIYPFAVIAETNVGDPYPKESRPFYSTPVEGVDVLNTKQFTLKEMCKQSKWDKDAKGRILKGPDGKNKVAEADPKAMRCVEMMNGLLELINRAFGDLGNHDLIKEIFVQFHAIENQCSRVFVREDCDSVRSGELTYQRISLLKANYESLIWAYNYLLYETERRSVGPIEEEGGSGMAGSGSGFGGAAATAGGDE